MKRFPCRTAPCRFATLPGKTVACAAGKAVSVLLLLLSVIPAMGQGRQVLTDGISGKDRLERYLFIQAISPQGDTCLVMTDSLGRFEIDAEVMGMLPGNVYLKPMTAKPKANLSMESPFDTIDAYRQGRTRYLAQNQIVEAEQEEPFYYDPDVTVLSEARIRARGNSIARDKVTGYLDSLAILASGEWVCDCGAGAAKGYLNDWHGYSHHPEGYNPPPPFEVKRLVPKRGEVYRIIMYKPGADGKWYMDMDHPPQDIVYTGPQYNEEELLALYGMSKAQGYYPVREFYEPDELDLASPTPDYRNLLQWRPAVLTDENGIAEVPFAASDVNTEFIGLVEAVDGTGLMGAQTFTFRVLK